MRQSHSGVATGLEWGLVGGGQPAYEALGKAEQLVIGERPSRWGEARLSREGEGGVPYSPDGRILKLSLRGREQNPLFLLETRAFLSSSVFPHTLSHTCSAWLSTVFLKESAAGDGRPRCTRQAQWKEEAKTQGKNKRQREKE